jgi:phosphoglycerate dehydrogenase-like enzyme
LYKIEVKDEGGYKVKIRSSIRIAQELQQDLKERFKLDDLYFYKNIKEAENELEDVEVLLTYGEDLTPFHIEKAKALKWIMVMSAGVDKLPFEAIKQRNILVTNARGIHKIPMAEYTVGMMLQYCKQLKGLYDQEREGNWNRGISISELDGKTALIIGAGAIGGQIAKICKTFGMRTLGINRSGEAVEYMDEITAIGELDRFLSVSDFIISVLPSTNETKGLLKRKHFEQMKKSSVFINIGRGSVIQESELIQIMKDQLIAHAILDVFEKEPLHEGHDFWSMDNVTVTPHISSITAKYLPRAFDIFDENLHIYKTKQNNFINKIDLNRGY